MQEKQTGFLVSGFIILLMGGCLSVGPDYQPPQTSVPDAWQDVAQGAFSADEADLQAWWTVFNDELLTKLIAHASTNNLDLKTTVARIEEAAALRGVSAAAFWPGIDATGAATVSEAAGDNSERVEITSAGLAMAWELDLWGRVRRSVESAEASLEASIEDGRDVMVLLNAEVATTYIAIRTLQERIAIAQSNLASQNETLELTRNRFDAGLVPTLDISQAELNLSRTAATLPPLRQSLVEAVNRLHVLTGGMPTELRDQLMKTAAIPAAPQEVSVGLPTELLRRRPDIRRAERQLAAQHARIGATQAEFYPTLTLPGTLTLESSSVSDGGTAYSFGPQLRWNLFSGGRIRNQVRAEDAATQAALHTYEQTVLLALEETEDAMASYAHEKDRVGHLETAAGSAEESVRLVNSLYKSGLTDFQNVLSMEEALLAQQDALASSRGRISTDLIAVYRSFGGGWESPEETP